MSSDEIIVLTLTPDNPSNTTITTATGDIAYIAVTENSKKGTFTQVRNAEEEVIAFSEWRDVRPDKITIGDRKPVSLGDWMRRSMIPFKDDISFSDDQGRKYKWKGNSPGRYFELYTADDNFAAPIARFNRSRTVRPTPNHSSPPAVDPSASVASLTPTLVDPDRPTWQPATLVLTARAAEIQDTVVTSFLFLEKTRRINETESQNRADVLGSAATSAGVGRSTLVNGGV
ncbi:hypothetical protein EIP86_011034 [Pleurotus ostreatoroseus]|nr:hypothetical protein EIP86_011034 [Pleurotus ostreatoroseus]